MKVAVTIRVKVVINVCRESMGFTMERLDLEHVPLWMPQLRMGRLSQKPPLRDRENVQKATDAYDY